MHFFLLFLSMILFVAYVWLVRACLFVCVCVCVCVRMLVCVYVRERETRRKGYHTATHDWLLWWRWVAWGIHLRNDELPNGKLSVGNIRLSDGELSHTLFASHHCHCLVLVKAHKGAFYEQRGYCKPFSIFGFIFFRTLAVSFVEDFIFSFFFPLQVLI